MGYASPSTMGAWLYPEWSPIAAYWENEIPTDRTSAQIMEIVSNLGPIYKATVASGEHDAAEFDPAGDHDRELVAYLTSKSGYDSETVREFLFSLEESYRAGDLDISHYNPAVSIEVKQELKTLLPGWWDRVTSAVSPTRGSFNKLLIAGAVVTVAVFLGREAIRGAFRGAAA